MTLNSHPRHIERTITSQHGAALVVALIFLIALTLLGLAATSGNTLQQRMAYSASETNLAFQSAETGIASGEAWIEARTDAPVPDCISGCASSASIWNGTVPPAAGPSGQSLKAGRLNFLDPAWWTSEARQFGFTYVEGAAPVAIPGQTIPEVALVPRYTIEYIGKDQGGSAGLGGRPGSEIQFYQITGRGSGVQAIGTPLIVQSVYSKRF